MSAPKPVIGNVYGRLTVTADPFSSVGGHRNVLCNCSCGTCCVVRALDAIKKTHTKGGIPSCGCYKPDFSTHGLSKHRLYGTWHNMIDRCHNPDNVAFGDYGGRGIYVCEEWRTPETGVPRFIADMGSKPTPGHTLERINNDGPYSKANCKWATLEEQQSNTRASKLWTINGNTKTLSAWARDSGINLQTLHHRVTRQRMSLEEALLVAMPAFTIARRFEVNGQSLTIPELSKLLGIPRQTLYSRLVQLDWSLTRAANESGPSPHPPKFQASKQSSR
jgi:hypothetical protein